MTEIDDVHVYRCRVKIREVSPIGNAAIPEVRDYLNGKELVLRPMWIGDEDDSYPGEWAMMLSRGDWMEAERAGHQFIWIASGDVEVLEQIDRKEWEI